ncbi:LAFA_0E05930g1_1 [Lachancea sp. 'fantastica']|nr:LAFA_0E05930g1_1 [Lachancea sp. 'fantastica']
MPYAGNAQAEHSMGSSYVVVQLGSRVVRVGHCGDPEPLVTYFWPAGEAFNERLSTFLFTRWFQDPLMVDCRQTRILIVENALLPASIKTMVTRIFQEMRVVEVIFVPDALMCLVAAGLRNGLVIDVGWEHLLAVPISDLRIVDCGLQFSIKGGQWLAAQITAVEPTAPTDTEEVVEKVLAKNSDLSDGLRLIQKKIDDELIGQSTADNFDLDEFPIVHLVSHAYDSLPIDVRKAVKKHLVMSGLASGAPALQARCEEMLPDFCFVDTLGPWIGGSLFFEQLIQKSLREDRKLNELVPNDWHAQRFKVYR